MISAGKRKLIFPILIIVGALFSGTLFILHQLIIAYKLWGEGKSYSFLSFAAPDPLVNLAPMIRDVLDGHIWISDGRIWENSGLPNLWSVLDPWLIAPLTFLTRSVPTALLLGHFLVGAATFIIVYLIARRLVGRKNWSFLFSLLFSGAPLLGYYLFPASLFNLKLVLRTILPFGSPPGEILMSKYVSFSVLPGLPIFALAFLFILLALEKKERKWQIFAGITHGLLIYVYLTDVMYLFTAMGIMAVMFFYQKRFSEVKKLVTIIGIAIITSALYWWNFFYIQFLPWSEEFYIRLGGELTHQFRASHIKEYIALIIFSFVIWFLGKRMGKQVAATYLMGLALAGIILLNLQVFVGYNPAPTVWSGHQMYFGLFLGWLAVAYWVYLILKQSQTAKAKYFSIFLAVLVVMVTLRIVYTQFFIASYLYPSHTLPPKIIRSLDWLNANTPRDSVVVSPSLITNALLPVFAHNNSLLPVAVTSAASQAEILDRFFVAYSLFGYSSEYIKSALKNELPKSDDLTGYQENGLTTWLFESYYVDHSIDGYFYRRTAEIPPEVTARIVFDYERYPKNQKYLLNRYRADYLYVGPYEKMFSGVDFGKLDYLEEVYNEEDVIIYKIKRDL